VLDEILETVRQLARTVPAGPATSPQFVTARVNYLLGLQSALEPELSRIAAQRVALTQRLSATTDESEKKSLEPQLAALQVLHARMKEDLAQIRSELGIVVRLPLPASDQGH
jgi:hypothetical protein